MLRLTLRRPAGNCTIHLGFPVISRENTKGISGQRRFNACGSKQKKDQTIPEDGRCGIGGLNLKQGKTEYRHFMEHKEKGGEAIYTLQLTYFLMNNSYFTRFVYSRENLTELVLILSASKAYQSAFSVAQD